MVAPFLGTGLESKVNTALKTLTFTGASGLGQSGTAVPIFTITGRVLVHLIAGFCTTNLTEGGATAQISLGTTNQVTRFIGAMNSVDLDENEWWVDTTPVVGSADPTNATGSPSVTTIVVSEDIIVDPTGGQDTDGGVVEFTVLWEKLSSGGSIVPA